MKEKYKKVIPLFAIAVLGGLILLFGQFGQSNVTISDTEGISGIEEISFGSDDNVTLLLNLTSGKLEIAGGDCLVKTNITAENLNIAHWDTAYGWGNHSSAGYLTSYTETDPWFNESLAYLINATLMGQWNESYTWGNHSTEGYAVLANLNVTDWDTAYTWGNHSGLYADLVHYHNDTYYTQAVLTPWISNWNTSYSWGNHTAQHYFDMDIHTTDNLTNGTWSVLFTVNNRTTLESALQSLNWSGLLEKPFNLTTPLNGQRILYNDTSGDWENTYNKVAQFHRVENISTDTADAWVNVTWDTEVEAETTTGFTLCNTNMSITTDFNGIVRVQGCLHLYKNETAQTGNVSCRVLVNDTEARCLQASRTIEFKSNGRDTLEFIGTIEVDPGSIITLQYYIDLVGIDFAGNTIFDNPVSASINFERID